RSRFHRWRKPPGRGARSTGGTGLFHGRSTGSAQKNPPGPANEPGGTGNVCFTLFCTRISVYLFVLSLYIFSMNPLRERGSSVGTLFRHWQAMPTASPLERLEADGDRGTFTTSMCICCFCTTGTWA